MKKILFLILLLISGVITFAEEKIVDVDGVKISYLEEGQGKKNIIFIHGFSGSANNWIEMFPYLLDEFKIYALDLPGFGSSDKPLDIKFNVRVYADYILKFMDKLKIEKAIFCGNSLGGAISIKIHLKDSKKVEKLILVNSAGYVIGLSNFLYLADGIPIESFLKVLKKFLNDDFYIRSVMKMVFFKQDIVDKIFDKYAEPLRQEGVVEFIVNLSRAMDDLNIKDDLPQVEVPTLIIWGEYDKVLPVENAYHFHKLIKNSQLKILKDAGHVPMEEYPQAIAKEIINFCQ